MINDFQQLNDIINESVTNSSYVTVIISSCVFIIYTLIIRLVDYLKSKNKNKPLLEMSKAMQEIGTNISKLNSVLDKTLQDAEKKEHRQCEDAIQLGFKAFAFSLGRETADIIAHNNIDVNKELIEENLKKLVSTEYFKLYSTLSGYEIKEVNVATKLKEEWIDEVTKAIITIVYNGQDSVSRIVHVNSKLSIYTTEYSTYINNKIFNA